MKTVVLNNGVEMPILGFGVFQIEDLAECDTYWYGELASEVQRARWAFIWFDSVKSLQNLNASSVIL